MLTTSDPAINCLKYFSVKNSGLIISTIPLVDIIIASQSGRSIFAPSLIDLSIAVFFFPVYAICVR